MYDTIIFDLDGTLLNTLEDLTDGVNYIMKAHGYPLHTIDRVRRFVGNGIRVLMERALPKDVTGDEFEERFCEFRSYYTEHCRIKTKPYDGIIDTINTLKAKGIKLAIVSNKNDAAVKALARYYFEGVIEIAIGERENIRRKPAPDTVLEAMKSLGCTQQGTLYVGDSEVDKQTADNADTACVLVDWGFRDRELLLSLEPEKVISHPQELLKMI